MGSRSLSITYSIADQSFDQTKSLGILNLSWQLLRQLAVRSEVTHLTVLSNPTFDHSLPLPRTVQWRLHPEAIRNRWQRLRWDQWGVYRAALQAGNRWLFLPKGFASFVQPSPVKLAAYVHDTIHDFYAQRYPKAVPRLERWYFERSFAATVKHARVILTNSEFTRQEVLRLAKGIVQNPPPVAAVGIGFEPPAEPVNLQDKDDTVVVLAGRWPHKRTDLALKYLMRWQQETEFTGRLEWVGSLPPGIEFPERINWRLHPRLPDPDYRRLLSQARVLVYFSEYEGFGMPPIEGILAGAIPVYSDIPSTREVLLGAGCPFDNDSYASFTKAMHAALLFPVDQLQAWARRLQAHHNWEQVAKRTAQALLAAG